MDTYILRDCSCGWKPQLMFSKAECFFFLLVLRRSRWPLTCFWPTLVKTHRLEDLRYHAWTCLCWPAWTMLISCLIKLYSSSTLFKLNIMSVPAWCINLDQAWYIILDQAWYQVWSSMWDFYACTKGFVPEALYASNSASNSYFKENPTSKWPQT